MSNDGDPRDWDLVADMSVDDNGDDNGDEEEADEDSPAYRRFAARCRFSPASPSTTETPSPPPTGRPPALTDPCLSPVSARADPPHNPHRLSGW